MSREHSKAPWSVTETERQAGRGGGLRIVDAAGGYVASLLSYENRRMSHERDADARLIACAPDLLWSVKALLNSSECSSECDNGCVNDCPRANARTLLARAEKPS